MLFRKILSISITALLLTGCSKNTLSIRNNYISYKDLASYYVTSPDPKKLNPDIGQRLTVKWHLSKEDWQNHDTKLTLKIRFYNREEKVIEQVIDKSRGKIIYEIINEDFQEKNGILTYYAEIVKDKTVIKKWRHQIWSPSINLDSK